MGAPDVATRGHTGALAALIVVVVTLLGTLMVTATPASAHASLAGTSPSDRAELAEAPDRVEVTFDEAVEVPAGGLRVFDADARRVDTGPVETGGPEVVAVGLPPDLPDGGYVLTYRVISMDSHPLGGVVTFTVGGGDPVDDAVVGELFGGAGDDVLGLVGPLLRGLGYLATLLAVGAFAFATSIARRDVDVRAARWLGGRAAIAGAVVSVFAVPVQGAAVAGVGVWEAATSTTVLGEVFASGFGEGTLLRVTGLFALWALWRVGAPAVLVGVSAGAGLGSYLIDGHQRSFEPAWLLRGADAVHLGAGAFWFGGLILLIGLLRRSSGDGDAPAAAGAVARFSSLALLSVAALGVAGVAMAIPLVGSPAALTSTGYGWTLVAKVAVVASIVLVAIYNRQRLVPEITAHVAPGGGSVDAPAPTEGQRAARADAAWRQLRTTLRTEAGLLVVVLLLTGFLVSQRPASEAAGLQGLYEATALLTDDLQVDLVVDPNRVGQNTMHVYLLDATGRPSTDVQDVIFELTYVPQDIGPIPVEPFFAGPGHWIANLDDFAFAGEWEVRVIAGVDRFTEASAVLRVPVAP